MAKYYATIAGLPNIGVDDRKLPISVDALQEELKEVLTPQDRKLLDLLLLEQELPLILDTIDRWLSDDTISWDDSPEEIVLPSLHHIECVDMEQLAGYLIAVRQRTRRPRVATVPSFIKRYLEERLPDPEQSDLIEESRERMAEELRESERPYTHTQLRLEQDRLTSMYYDHLVHHRVEFVAAWAEFNLHIRNILAAYTTRQLKLDPKEYIVGDGEIEHLLRTSQAGDFAITAELFPPIQQLVNISHEDDIARREQLLDRLRWEWLDDYTFDKPFDIESLLAYFLQLEILERWVSLNEEKGEQIFRQIVSQLKHQSTASLDEFKRKQKK